MRNIKDIKQKLIERDGLRCSMTGETVSNPDELTVDHIIPKSKGGTDELDNLILTKRHINAAIADDERKRVHLLVKELRERQEILAEREAATFKREQEYRKQLEIQQAELEKTRYQLRIEQTEREERYQAELNAQRKLLDEQQFLISEKFKESQLDFTKRLKDLEVEKIALTQEIKEREERLQRSYEELELEKKKYTEESRKKIESSSAAYVNEALTSLDSSANSFHKVARNWSLAGLISLLFGVGSAVYFGLAGVNNAAQSTIDWPQVIFFGIKGIVVVILFIAISKYCYSYSQSFMHESLKNRERKHAINFGKFYLQSYGANAEWTQVKEAFEHWNITPSSAFSKSNPDTFDPKPIELAAQLLDSISKFRSQKEEGTDSSKKA